MPKRRRNRQIGGIIKRRLLGPVVGVGARYLYNKAHSYVTSKTGQKSHEMAPLTAEKDVRVTYRKRRMPRRKKKAYIRRLRNWRSMELKSEPSRISFFLFNENVTAALNTSRYFGAFMGLLSQNNYDNNLGEVWNQMTVAGNTAAAKARQAFLRLDHQSLSVTIRNVSTAVANGSGIIDMDVYKVICIKDIPNVRWVSGLPIESMHAALKSDLRSHQGMDIEVGDNVLGVPVVQESAGTGSATQAVGDVLFNAPPFLRYWKVLKCWKVQISPGQVVNFNWRDSKNYTVHRDMCFTSEGASLAAKKYVTKGYIFNINGRAINAAGFDFESVSCVVEHNVRYNCKPIINHSDTLVFDGQ